MDFRLENKKVKYDPEKAFCLKSSIKFAPTHKKPSVYKMKEFLFDRERFKSKDLDSELEYI